MENTQQPRSFKSFIMKYGYLFPSLFALISIVVFISSAPILNVAFKNKTVDPVLKWSEIYNFYQIIQNFQKYDFSIYVMFGLALVGIVFCLLKKLHKSFASISFIMFALATFMIGIYPKIYAFNPIDYLNEVNPKWGLMIAAIFMELATLGEFVAAYNENKMSVRDIAEDGMLIAMAFVLNLIKLFPMPTGGSVNLQMLPLFIIALRHGPLHGFISAGIVYGLLTCLTDGYGIMTFPFDYLIGFGSASLIGIFRHQILTDKTNYNIKGEIFIALGGIIATIGRLAGGTISSIVVYEYSFEEAFLYNLGYVSISGVIAVAILMALYGPIAKINYMINERNSIEQAE